MWPCKVQTFQPLYISISWQRIILIKVCALQKIIYKHILEVPAPHKWKPVFHNAKTEIYTLIWFVQHNVQYFWGFVDWHIMHTMPTGTVLYLPSPLSLLLLLLNTNTETVIYTDPPRKCMFPIHIMWNAYTILFFFIFETEHITRRVIKGNQKLHLLYFRYRQVLLQECLFPVKCLCQIWEAKSGCYF